MIGLNFINEMSKEDLIEEILAVHKDKLATRSINELKIEVINIRIERARDALVKEAGLETRQGALGTYIVDPDETSE